MARYDLNDKVALVSCAARGIGFETAKGLHERAASVVLVDLDAEATTLAAKQVGTRSLGIAADPRPYVRPDVGGLRYLR